MNSPHGQKPQVADLIKTGLIKKYGGLKKALKHLGLPSYDALRQDLSKNRFFEQDLILLCRSIDLSADINILKREYDFTLKKQERGIHRMPQAATSEKITLSDTFSSIDARMDRLAQLMTSAKEVVPKFFDAMGERDLLAVFLGDEVPVHWGGPDAATSAPTVCGAIGRGAMIVYFHPSNDLAERIQKTGCSAPMLSENNVRPAFENFQRKMIGLGATAEHVSNLQVVACDNPAVFTPQHRYGIYFHHGEGALQVRATESIPVRYDAGVDEAPSRYWVFASGYRFTSFLQQVCEWTLNQEIERLSTIAASGADPSENAKRNAQLQKMLNRCYFINDSSDPSKSQT